MTLSREERERNRESSPSRVPDTNSPPQAGDYAIHTVQTVLEMQKTLGGVENAIENLKDESKEHGKKLEQIGKDVHAAKVVLSVVGGLIVLAAAFIGWTINTLLQYFLSHPVK